MVYVLVMGHPFIWPDNQKNTLYIYIYISTLTYFTLRCVFLWITMKNMMATMSINAFTLISSTHDLMTQGYEHSAGVYILQFCYFSHPGSSKKKLKKKFNPPKITNRSARRVVFVGQKLWFFEKIKDFLLFFTILVF